MRETINLDAPGAEALGRRFRNIGRLGFWAQVILAIAPLLIGAGAFFMSDSVNPPGARFNVLGMLAIASLLVLVFTTFWFRRYMHIADRIGGMSPRSLRRTVWTGLTASSTGIALSIIVLVFEVTYMLFLFLEAPQGGVPVLQTSVEAASWVSAIHMLSVLALVLTIAAEIIALVLGLILLNHVWRAVGSED